MIDTYPSMKGKTDCLFTTLLLRASSVCTNDGCMNCCFCINILSCDWLAMFIKSDDEEHMLCIPENMLGREIGTLLDDWVVLGIRKMSSLSSSLTSQGTITLSLWSLSSNLSSCLEVISSPFLSEESSGDGCVFSSDLPQLGSGEFPPDSLGIASGGLSAGASASEVTSLLLTASTSNSSSIFASSLSESRSSSVTSLWPGVPDLDCCVNLSLFRHFALRFWNHT